MQAMWNCEVTSGKEICKCSVCRTEKWATNRGYQQEVLWSSMIPTGILQTTKGMLWVSSLITSPEANVTTIIVLRVLLTDSDRS